MKTVILDGKIHVTPQKVYEGVYKALNDGYMRGKNLDGLWDFLSTDVERPFCISWKNVEVFKKAYPQVFSDFIALFDRLIGYDEKMRQGKNSFSYQLDVIS